MNADQATALVDAFSRAEQNLTLWAASKTADPADGVRLGRVYGQRWVDLMDALMDGELGSLSVGAAASWGRGGTEAGATR